MSQLQTRNLLLATMPPLLQDRLLASLRPVSLPIKTSLVRPGEQIEGVFFIESGWISMVRNLDDGSAAEVGLVGREGMIGAALIGGAITSYTDTYAQSDATALRMDARVFQREAEDNPELRRLIFRYNEAMYAQAMQTAACNGRHHLKQRLARWILIAHDRWDGDEVPLTQEFLSLMLCVRRSSVSELASELQQEGMIRYSRGKIAIVSRAALEARTCDCYKAVQDRFKELAAAPT